MACSLPVIVSNVGGNKEVIKHLENGLRFQVGSHDDLSKKIHFLFNNEKSSKLIGENARKTIMEKYTLEQTFYEYEKIYNLDDSD